ncbi:hypothetical protein MBLNU457_7633t1 [Dothideomycetes sp. NU457]
MSAAIERDLLNHYRLTNLYPSEWPEREDESDPSEDELEQQQTKALQSRPSRRASRYSGLDRRTKFKSRLSGAADAGEGSGNIVQKDEQDPLGIAPSVVQELRRRGLSVEDDLKLRNKFMLSSTTFSPTLFLSQVHQQASTEDLLQGLDFLSKSIEKKSASLKVLVESNFERFVKAKATIDNVYNEMRAQGQGQSAPPPTSARPHSRHNSRGGGHFRKASNPFSIPNIKPEDMRKNSLTKETEYGVLGIKAPLIEIAVKAEEVWGPALGGRDREENLKSILSFVETNRTTLELAGNIQTSIRKHDYETLIREYRKARRLSQEAKAIADAASHNNATLTDPDIRQVIVAAKMWYDVENQVELFRKSALRQLSNVDMHSEGVSHSDRHEMHTELISVLLQVGTDENPIWLWLSSWSERLRSKISNTSERCRLDIEVLRRKLASGEPPSVAATKAYLSSPSQGSIGTSNADSVKILQFWDLVESSLKILLDHNGGLLGEVADYWESARSFIEGRAQKNLPNSTWTSAATRQHISLSPEHKRQLQAGAADLVHLLRDAVFLFFTDPPIEDISDLVSPIPQTPITPASALGPGDASRKFKFDPADIPPPSPKRGEAWEEFAFWPPHATSLSGVQYLSRALVTVGSAASDAAALSVVKEDTRLMESLRALVGGVRERCVQAVCAAWNTDAEKCKVLEDWTRNGERRDLTSMPDKFMSFEETILSHMQKILFLSEAMTRADSSDVVVPPSAKLLQMVRSQFVTSLYKALSGAVENAERSKKIEGIDDNLQTNTQRLSINTNVDAAVGLSSTVDRNVRMLLTLSNLNYLRREIIPQLISQFETSFSVKLAEESKTIRDVLGQIDSRLFQSYVKPTVDKLSATISNGVASPAWMPQTPRPTNAKPYVYDVLLTLVLVHTEVSTSATALTNQILSYLLEQVSTALLDAFRKRPSYTLPALMQATLDVELIAQTLSNYTTEKASELQSQIYLVLDERTDSDARQKLQSELPEMRATLKKLREGTKGQFGCFKRERRGRTDQRPGTSGSK